MRSSVGAGGVTKQRIDLVKACDVTELWRLLVDQRSNQIGYGHGLGSVGTLQVEGRDVLSRLVGQVIGTIEIILRDLHAVDRRILPVPETGEVDLLAHVGLAKHRLADHAVRGQRDNGGRHTEAGGMEAIKCILQLGRRLAQLISQRLGIGKGEQYAVSIEAQRLLDVDAIQQRYVDGTVFQIIIQFVVLTEIAFEVHVDRIAFQHHGTFVVRQHGPNHLRIPQGLVGNMLQHGFHLLEFVVAHHGRMRRNVNRYSVALKLVRGNVTIVDGFAIFFHFIL